eukprot:16437090-Heterocapsa_arctica.AAC.1
MSNELDKGDDNYMLHSLRAQSTFGFVKDTVTGKFYLMEYDDYCQLYEAEGSGLRAICVSDFEDKKSAPVDYPREIRTPKQWEEVSKGDDKFSYLNSSDEGEFPKDFANFSSSPTRVSSRRTSRSATDIGNDMKKDLIIEAHHDLGEDQ